MPTNAVRVIKAQSAFVMVDVYYGPLLSDLLADIWRLFTAAAQNPRLHLREEFPAPGSLKRQEKRR